jgi:hypothetical protein
MGKIRTAKNGGKGLRAGKDKNGGGAKLFKKGRGKGVKKRFFVR